MEAVLLDTDVFSYLTRANDARGDVYRPHVRGKTIAISFITVGEIYFGAEKAKWGTAKLNNFLERLKAVVVVPYDIEICATYGKLKASLRGAGLIVGDNDLWIASCAIRHSIPLFSNNRRHFENISGLDLISFAPTNPSQKPKASKLFEEESPD
jgi:tRNA(fMet)-specific endonuclease VapC